MRKIVIMAFLMFGMLVAYNSNIWAGELDILVDKLVEKGILSPVEAQIVLDETKQQVAKEVAEGKSSSLPKWVQNTKLKGDLRLRYQYEKKTNDSNSRNRGRVRYRLGLESKVNDEVKVGLGLASGGSDPRSTNQTFQNTFDSPDIRLDLAFAEYTPKSDFKIIAGKFKRKPYLWAPTDLLWDGDINPEGASFNYQGSLVENTDAWFNTGIWILDENGKVKDTDPFLNYVQGGLKYKKGKMDAKLASTFYNFQGIKDTSLDYSARTNTGASTGLQSTYRSIGTSTEVGFKELLGGLPFSMDERVAFFGDFIQNLDDDVIDDELTGWAYGLKFGNKKVKKPKQWQFKYTRANLQKDAFPDAFPDSDRFGGATGIESHEVAWKYALMKNVIFGVDYYTSWSLDDDDNIETLVQSDLLFKF